MLAGHKGTKACGAMTVIRLPRTIETLPSCAYVAAPLLVEMGVDVVMILNAVEEGTARAAIDVLLAADASRPYMAVRTEGGFTVLREAPE